MGLFNSTCCPPRPKRTMDYILNWIDTNSLIISKNTSFINDLIEWRRSIENALYGHVKDVADEYITNYDWSNVPEFDVLIRDINTKADKVIPIAANTIATWDINGNLQDSEKTLSDFVRKPETFTSGNLISFNADGNLQDSGKKTSDFAPAAHTHSGIEDVVEGRQYAKLYADNMTQGNPSIVIELADEDGRSVTKVATIDLLNTIDNLIRALNDPDTVPNASSDNLITSGAVYNALNSFNVTTIGDDTASVSAGQSSIEIETPSLNIVISDEGQGTEINIDANNAANLDRALKDPDTTPKINSNELITSGGVKSALNSLSSNLSQDIDERLATKAAAVHAHSIADINNLQQELSRSVIPAGTIAMWGGATAPDGWLLCDDKCIPVTSTSNLTVRAGYENFQNLVDVIGTNFGVAHAGQSTSVTGETVTGDRVLIPNFKRKFPLGPQGTSASNDTWECGSRTYHTSLGQIGGTNEVTLTADESGLPEHTHDISYGKMAFSTHSESGTGMGMVDYGSQTLSTTASSLSASNAHNNVPPYLAINFIIKY